MLGEVFKQSNISPNISANKFYKCWERCSNDPTFHPTFHPTFLLGYDLNTLWRSCAFETWNHDQNANGARFFKGERMRNANNVVWGVQMAQHFTQDLKTMKLLATVTQHFWLKSNFTQHRKCQCWEPNMVFKWSNISPISMLGEMLDRLIRPL